MNVCIAYSPSLLMVTYRYRLYYVQTHHHSKLQLNAFANILQIVDFVVVPVEILHDPLYSDLASLRCRWLRPTNPTLFILSHFLCREDRFVFEKFNKVTEWWTFSQIWPQTIVPTFHRVICCWHTIEDALVNIPKRHIVFRAYSSAAAVCRFPPNPSSFEIFEKALDAPIIFVMLIDEYAFSSECRIHSTNMVDWNECQACHHTYISVEFGISLVSRLEIQSLSRSKDSHTIMIETSIYRSVRKYRANGGVNGLLEVNCYVGR